jgi:hypothetical protein
MLKRGRFGLAGVTRASWVAASVDELEGAVAAISMSSLLSILRGFMNLG